jgi:haloacetate dehalogenase
MTDKARAERRALVRGITAVSAAALSSTLLPKCAVAQAANPSSSATSDRFEGAEIKVGDNTIFIRRYGRNGSPLLMVHGFPRSSLMWRFVAPQLASNYTVICVDLRGYAAAACQTPRKIITLIRSAQWAMNLSP